MRVDSFDYDLPEERIAQRPLADRTPLVRTTVTIGWLLVLQEMAGVIWGKNAYHQAVKVITLRRLLRKLFMVGGGEEAAVLGVPVSACRTCLDAEAGYLSVT